MQDLTRTAGVPWGWSEGPVDPSGSHFSIHEGDLDGPVAARVGLSERGAVVVEILCSEEGTAKALRRNLRLQLEKPRTPAMESLGPWNFAIHHCETADNLYSGMVWQDRTR